MQNGNCEIKSSIHLIPEIIDQIELEEHQPSLNLKKIHKQKNTQIDWTDWDWTNRMSAFYQP